MLLGSRCAFTSFGLSGYLYSVGSWQVLDWLDTGDYTTKGFYNNCSGTYLESGHSLISRCSVSFTILH